MTDAPWYRDPIETTAFNLYAMEKEGLFLTPEERLEMVVEYLASVDNPNDKEAQSEAFILAGINTNLLTDNEISVIENEATKRWNSYHQ